MSASVMLVMKCKRQPEMPPLPVEQAFDCDDWWLVEAENVFAARKAIEHFERDPDARCVHGRVLAHGGKR